MPALTVSNLLVGFQQRSTSGESDDAEAPVSFQDVMTSGSAAGEPTDLRQQPSVIEMATSIEQVVAKVDSLVSETESADASSEELVQPFIAAAILSIPTAHPQLPEPVAAVDASRSPEVLVPQSADALISQSAAVLVSQEQGETRDGHDPLERPGDSILAVAPTQQPAGTQVITDESASLPRRESVEDSPTTPVLTTPVLTTPLTAKAETEPAQAQQPIPAGLANSSNQRVDSESKQAVVPAAETGIQAEPARQASQPQIASDGETDAPKDRQTFERPSTREVPEKEVRLVKEDGNTIAKLDGKPTIPDSTDTVAPMDSDGIAVAPRQEVTAGRRNSFDAPQRSEVTRQVMSAMKEAVEFSDGSSIRPISQDLRPQDQVRLNTQMAPAVETVATQIVATESAGDDDLVNQNETLPETLADLGAENASVDFSHQNDQQPGNQPESHSTSRPPREQAESVFTPNDTRIDAGLNPAAPRSDSVMVDAPSKAIQPTVESIAGTRPAEVTKQVVTAMREIVDSSDGSTTRTVSLELHPEELGHLKIHIEQTAEAIATQIIASELISSDLLTNQKDALLEALTDLGFEDASVDISHDERSQSSPQQDSNRDRTGKSFAQNDSHSTGRRVSVPTSNGLNIVV